MNFTSSLSKNVAKLLLLSVSIILIPNDFVPESAHHVLVSEEAREKNTPSKKKNTPTNWQEFEPIFDLLSLLILKRTGAVVSEEGAVIHTCVMDKHRVP